MTLPVRKRKSYQEQESRMSELARKAMRRELKRLHARLHPAGRIRGRKSFNAI